VNNGVPYYLLLSSVSRVFFTIIVLKTGVFKRCIAGFDSRTYGNYIQHEL